MAELAAADRREMDESVSNPTAMIVRRIIRLSVMTKAKPRRDTATRA